MTRRQVVIVTGAGQGIGLEICRRLVAAGAQVVLNDLEESLALEAAQQLQRSGGGTCIPVAGDASDPAVIGRMVQAAVTHFGGLDAAVANAGITLFGDFMSYTPEALNRVMQVNVAGTFLLAQAAARQMQEQGSGGSLLFMSSVTGHQAHKNLGAYGMSKAAIEMLARNLVIELSPFRININAIAPGATLTERTREDPTYETVWSAITPMGRPGTVGDVAATALFLISEEARQITGQTLVIDGGWSCISPSPYTAGK